MTENSTSWLSATGQRWKLVVFGVLMAINATQVLGLVVSLHRGSADDVIAMFGMGTAATIVLAIAWFGLSIKCPACGGRAGWFVITRGNISSWLGQLVTSNRCLMCRARPAS